MVISARSRRSRTAPVGMASSNLRYSAASSTGASGFYDVLRPTDGRGGLVGRAGPSSSICALYLTGQRAALLPVPHS